MDDIILNERAVAEESIAFHTLGNKPGKTLMCLAKYYHAEGYKKDEINRMLEEFVIRCRPYTVMKNWYSIIDYASNNAGKYPLIEIESVDITKSELDAIADLEGATLKRLMFTLLCLAKYGNRVSEKNNNWVNKEHKQIFSMIGMKLNSDKQAKAIRSLWLGGYVELSKIIDNVNLRVTIVNDDSPVVMKISDFRNLGNQYMQYCGENYFKCECCGLTVKRASNRQKYCTDCANERVNAKRRKSVE